MLYKVQASCSTMICGEKMRTPMDKKSSTNEIQERFDNDVERFSNLVTGQSATIDAPLSMELVTSAAVHTTNPIRRVLDIGCGATGNVKNGK